MGIVLVLVGSICNLAKSLSVPRPHFLFLIHGSPGVPHPTKNLLNLILREPNDRSPPGRPSGSAAFTYPASGFGRARSLCTKEPASHQPEEATSCRPRAQKDKVTSRRKARSVLFGSGDPRQVPVSKTEFKKLIKFRELCVCACVCVSPIHPRDPLDFPLGDS